MWQKALLAFRSTWAAGTGAAQLCRPAPSAFAAESPFALRRVTRRLVLAAKGRSAVVTAASVACQHHAQAEKWPDQNLLYMYGSAPAASP